MDTKKLTRMALLTTVALVIFVAEAQIPNPVPIPGVKLGLSNIVTVYAVFALGSGPALSVLICRIVLGSIFTGQILSFFYSLAGGLLCFLGMILIKRILTLDQIWVASVIGAVCHNIGQIIVAVIITRTPAIVSYLPVLMAAGVIAGLITGLAAQTLIKRFKRT